MRFQKTIKNNWQKKYNNKNKLEQLIIRSNLLGQDLKITNFGGGNTSSKIISKDPINKKNQTVLYVKGSGVDLGSIKKVYNNKIGWLDWQRPGFDLGLKMEKLIKKK